MSSLRSAPASSVRLSARRIGPWLVLALAVGLSRPEQAHAWADAHVETASATVDVDTEGAAHVALELAVRVRGGWMEGLEVAGLDPDLVLDEEAPPTWFSEEGERFDPRVKVRDGGRITFSFRRRTSPRRGRYRVTLAYRTSLVGRAIEPAGDGKIRVSWTLPGWRTGLDGVRISLRTPGDAAQPEAITETQALIDHDRRRDGDHTVLSWRRAHLPRTVPWTVTADVPETAMHPDLRAPASPKVPTPRAPATPPQPPSPREAPWMLAAWIALLAVLRIGAFRDACRQRGVAARPLLPLPAGARTVLALICAGAGGWFFDAAPIAAFSAWVGAVLTAIERTPEGVPAPRLGGFRPATRADIDRARRAIRRARWSLLGCLDGGRPTGLLVLLAAVWLVGEVHRVDTPLPPEVPLSVAHGLLLLVPLLLTGSPRQLPTAPEARLARLVTLAGELPIPWEVALALSVHQTVAGAIQDARLRLVTAIRPVGLVRMDLVLADRVGSGGRVAVPRLLLVTREASPAERRLHAIAPDLEPVRGPAGRLARTLPWDERARDVVDAIRQLPQRVPASRVVRPTRPRSLTAQPRA